MSSLESDDDGQRNGPMGFLLYTIYIVMTLGKEEDTVPFTYLVSFAKNLVSSPYATFNI